MELEWWTCPKGLCKFIGGGIEEEDLNCVCDNLKCKHISPEDLEKQKEEEQSFLDKLKGGNGDQEEEETEE